MRTLQSRLLLPLIFFNVGCTAQIKNSTITTVKIDGDCGMCEKTIEKVAYRKGEAEADWDVDAKTFDSTRTDLDAILQRLAHAGYDNERYLAPKEAYDKLPGCCQYERTMEHEPVKGMDAHAEHTAPAGDSLSEQGSTTECGAGSPAAGLRCLLFVEGCTGGIKCQ